MTNAELSDKINKEITENFQDTYGVITFDRSYL